MSLPSPELALLAARLIAPLGAVTMSDAINHWRETIIRVVCLRPQDLEETPVLPSRIRGAWGRILATGEYSTTRRRFGQLKDIRAYDALFENVCNWLPGRPVPRPFVIAVDYFGDQLIVELRLFGLAGFWADEAREALLSALQQGIKIRDGGPMFVRLVPIDCLVGDTEGKAFDTQAGSVTLRFLTPIAMRSKGHDRFGATSLLMSLANRVSGLARWHDLEIVENWRHLKTCAERLSTVGSETWPVQWERHSRRQIGSAIPVSAMMGKIVLNGVLDPFLPLLKLGESCFAGSHCALGLGRYELIILPH